MIRIHCRNCPIVTAGFTVLDALRASDLHNEEEHAGVTE